MKEKLKHEIKFTPAFDKRNPDPKKNYGIHCMDVWFTVKGKNGAITFRVFSGWFLEQNKHPDLSSSYPMAADIVTHSKIKRNEDDYYHEKCEATGKDCYTQLHSLLWSGEVLKTFIAEGEPYLWKVLENVYREELKDEN